MARNSAPFASDDFKFQFYQQPQGWPGPKVTTDMPTHGQYPPGSLRADADRSLAKACDDTVPVVT